MNRVLKGIVLCLVLLSAAVALGSNVDGVWKDVPKNQTGDRYALYMQTYNTGSIVIIVLDNSGGTQRLYAFLDSDYTNGVSANEVGGANALLTITDLESASPSATFNLGGNSETFTCHKWYEGPPEDTSPDPVDGIYKDAAMPTVTPFNVYLQTYPAEGSAIAVVTANGGMSYYPFLQSGFSSGIDVDDLLGQGAHLTLAISGPTATSFSFTPPGQAPYSGQLYRWFQAPVSAGSFTIKGTVLHNGLPMPTFTSAAADFWVRNELTGQVADQVVTSYDTSTGAYEIQKLPPQAMVSVSFHVTGSESTLPGNYRLSKTVYAATMTDAERRAYDLDASIIIHLTSPNDNSLITMPWSEPYPVHTTPVPFEWETVPGATIYSVYIYRYRDTTHPSGYGYIDRPVKQDIATTSYDAYLTASAANEHYEFTVYAYNGSLRVGYFMITYQAGYGWDYRFKAGTP